MAELYEILALRQRVFVVEQNCIYSDLDGLDDRCRHLWIRDATAGAGAIAAYLRILPAGLAFAEPSLGRVIVSTTTRGTGLGRELMRQGLARLFGHHGRQPVRIGAQAYLLRFYESLGFRRAGADYLEDGISHLEMLLVPDADAIAAAP